MRRGARDSQVINNFFSFATIVIISVVLILYKTFILKDESPKIEKLQCQKESQTRVFVNNLEILEKSFNAMAKGYYKLDGGMIESSLESSTLKKNISLDEINGFFIESIGNEPKKDIKSFLKINYEIVEFDKKESEKLDYGVLMTSFRINSNEVFRVNTNIKFMYSNGIKNRVDCTMKVFKNYVEYSRK